MCQLWLHARCYFNPYEERFHVCLSPISSFRRICIYINTVRIHKRVIMIKGIRKVEEVKTAKMVKIYINNM